MSYAIYALPILISLLLITENRILEGFIKGLFGIPDEVNVYDQQARFWWVVALFRWPFLLGYIGYLVSIPYIPWDFLVMLIGGLGYEWRRYKHTKAAPEKLKQLPATAIDKSGVIDL